MNYKNDLSDIDHIVVLFTKQGMEQRKATIRAYSRLTLMEQIEVIKRQKKIFHKIRNKDNDISLDVITYCSFILSVTIQLNELKNLNNLDFDKLSIDEIKQLSLKKAELFKLAKSRKQKKRDILLNYWSVVKTLRDDKSFSYREIQVYLKKYHRLEISYSTIYSCWHQLERKENK